MKSLILSFLLYTLSAGTLFASTLFLNNFKDTTFKSDKQNFHDDHDLSQSLSQDLSFFEIVSRRTDNVVDAQEISDGLSLKSGRTRTYENENFSSIQFLFGEETGEDETTYFVEMVERETGRAYYSYLILEKPFFAKRNDSPLNKFRTVSLYPVKGPLVFNLEERAQKGFSEIERLFKPEKDYQLRPTAIRSRLLLPNWKPSDDEIVVALPTLPKEALLPAIENFNSKMSARPPYLFSGSSNDLLNLTEPYLRSSVVKPICYMIEQISGNNLDNGVASVSVQPYSCVIESLGIMKVSLIRANDIKCKPGSCSFSVSIHCNTQAAALRQSCNNINSGLKSMFGETNGVPVEVSFKLNGEILGLRASIQ